jgi:hypothetical protein
MAVKNIFIADGQATVFKTTFGITDKDLFDLKIHSGGIVDTADYTVDGIGDSSGELTITYPGAIDLEPGTEITALGHSNVDEGDPDASSLTDFTAADFISPQAIQNEYVHLYKLIGMVIGGADLALIDLSTASNTLDRMNSVAELLFNEPSLDGDLNWDGSNGLPDTVEQLFEDVSDLASMINSDAGLPVPLTPSYILQAVTPLVSQWVDPDALLQLLPAFIALEARVGINETDISTNATDIGTNATAITNLQNDKFDDPSPATVWTSANDGPGSGLDADLLDGYQSSQSDTPSTVAVRDNAGRLDVAKGGNATEAVRVDQFLPVFDVNGLGDFVLDSATFSVAAVLFVGNSSVVYALPSASTRLYYAAGIPDTTGLALSTGLVGDNGWGGPAFYVASKSSGGNANESIQLSYIPRPA